MFEDDNDALGNGCLVGLLQLFGFLMFWNWAERKTTQDRDSAFVTQMTLLGAGRSAAEWNAAVEEGFYDDEES